MSTATLDHRSPAVPARPLSRADEVEARSPGVRLTRRGRLLVTLVVLIGLIAAVVAGAASVAAGSASSADAAPTTTVVVVQPGQTLWELAAGAAGGGDTREVVRQIRLLNGLTGSGVVPGQALTVPLG